MDSFVCVKIGVGGPFDTHGILGVKGFILAYHVLGGLFGWILLYSIGTYDPWI